MDSRFQDSYVHNGKTYKILSSFFHDAFAEIGILTFRYFPQDKLLMCSEPFMKHLHCERFYDNMPSSFANKFFSKDDQKRIIDMAKRLDAGEKKVSEVLTSKENHTSLVTAVAIELDKKNKTKVVAGLVVNIDGVIRSKKTIEALSIDYGSVYFVDYKNDSVIPQRIGDEVHIEYGSLMETHLKYEQILAAYIKRIVLEVEQEEMRYICSPENLVKQFKKNPVYIHDFRAVVEQKIVYYRMKFVNLSDSDELTAFVVAFSDISKFKNHELEKMAFVDPVTDGNNYNYFKKRVREINESGYLVSMDIHQFKIINSICGVAYGDRVLRAIWKTLSEFIKKDDIAGHVNADHFVIYVPKANKKEIIDGIEHLTDALYKLSVDMRCPRIRPYFGIAKWDPRKRIEESYSLTTIAKHVAKEQKTLNYLFYSEEESSKIIEQKALEDAFPEALANNNFEVWYQPKFSPHTGRMVGAEALVRLRLPNGELVPPLRFIPVFEKDGLIRTLDEYVFDVVCHFIKDRIRSNLSIVPISVNLSRSSLCYEGIVEQYINIVNDVGISPELVPIEITESTTADNSAIKDITEKFRQNGFVLCMDDFGTGYSSLAMLNLLRFDNLKLDKTLIDGIEEDSGHKLIKHIIALSKDLGMNITAEGVEYEAQNELLKDLNCDSIQGFFYKPPLQKKDFEKLLQ